MHFADPISAAVYQKTALTRSQILPRLKNSPSFDLEAILFR